MVVLDLDGKIVEGDLKPSSDTASHLYIYRHRPDVGGVVHTHSPYATAFAAVGKPIPVYLTAIADEFGGPIPCGGFALIGGEEIGKVVVESSAIPRRCCSRITACSPSARMPKPAVKAAVMVEDVARAVPGILILRRRRVPVWPLLAFAANVVVVVAAVTFGQPRYRAPVDVAVTVLAAVALSVLLRRRRVPTSPTPRSFPRSPPLLAVPV